MARTKPHPSLKGKKPVNTFKRQKSDAKVAPPKRNPSHIRNKLKRSREYGKYLQQKRDEKRQQRKQTRDEQLGEDVQKPIPRTIDNTREVEPTIVQPTDQEVHDDEQDDEFAPYLQDTVTPKVLITTRPRPSQTLFYFIADLQRLIPALHFYPRKSYSVKEICQFAANRDFTHLIVLSEKYKKCNGMTISHLRRHDSTDLAGPTAFFKLTHVVTSKEIPNHGASTSHVPELNLHGFGTRLGHRVGRLLASLFPHAPQHEGRQVVTVHNQRDFLFVRHHRYIFEEKKSDAKEQQQQQQPQQQQQQQQARTLAAGGGENETNEQPQAKQPNVKARLQELGPRFTLKLKWLQEGAFDTKHGEYEWIHKRKEMDSSRRKFHL